MTTDSETAFSAPHPEAGGSERDSTRIARGARESVYQTAPETAPTNDTQRDRRRGGWGRLVDQLTPPEPWSHRPASLAAMARYAARGGWTGPEGLPRRLGVWWYRLVVVPVTLVCHYTAWIVARPSRTVVTVVVWAVLMRVPPVHAAAAAVLPWDPWPLP